MSKFSVFHSDLLNETYHFYRHPSGMKIYVFPKKMTTTYALLATDFGSVDRTGARIFESVALLPFFLQPMVVASITAIKVISKFSDIFTPDNLFFEIIFVFPLSILFPSLFSPDF